MATQEGLRRSTRVRKAVKTYAEEQSAQADEPASAPPPKRKRKKPVSDEDEESVPEPAKKVNKKKATDDNEDAAAAPETKKAYKAPKPRVDAPSWHAEVSAKRIAANNRNVRRLAPGQAEKRLRSYVDEPDQSFRNALKKCNKERMFVLERARGVEEDCHANHDDCPCESVEMAGSTGNVYTVTISHMPSCTCPAGIFNRTGAWKPCKHIVYVLHNVLKVPEHLEMQHAFLTTELKAIFANAPALPAQIVEEDAMDGKRKPVEDDCPICCMEFEADEDVTWCRAACGNNIHKSCFDQWAKTKMGHVTCPFCRSAWDYGKLPSQKVNVASVDVPDEVGGGGYRNVRELLAYDD